ncbi:MAG: ABC transporter substrate-binding protein [Rhodobiaceae bacterium]|nr:ABC transporter substrate-binding protein [Rhodobiaceae bacterium]
MQISQKAQSARAISLVLAGVLLISQAFTAQAVADERDAAAARQIVEKFSQSLVSSVRNDSTTTYKDRFDALLPVFRENFALNILARATVGKRVWEQWSDSEQADYQEVLARFLTGTLVRRVKNDKGYKFSFVGIEPGPRSSLIARTLLERDAKDPIELDYRLDKVGGRWMISDVFAESAVSEVALRRAEFSGTIRSGGQSGLIVALEEKLTAFENDG